MTQEVLTYEGLQRYHGKMKELLLKKIQEHAAQADETYVHQDQYMSNSDIDDAIDEAGSNA